MRAGRNPHVRLPRGEHWHAHAARHDRRRRRFRRFARRAAHPPSGARVAGRTRVTGPALALVVAAAGLHALWNALAKRSGDLVAFFCLTSAVAALVLAAPAAWIVARDGLRAAGAPFIVATVALHALYFYGLARSYGSGAYSAVYPVARGLGVALVPVLACAAPLDRRRRRDERARLPARALRLPAFEGRVRRGLARALDPLLGGHREPLARRGTPRTAARRRLRHPGGRALRGFCALISGAEPRTRIPRSSRGPDAQDAKLQRKRSVSGSSFWRCLGSPCRSWCRSGDSNPDTLAGTRP